MVRGGCPFPAFPCYVGGSSLGGAGFPPREFNSNRIIIGLLGSWQPQQAQNRQKKHLPLFSAARRGVLRPLGIGPKGEGRRFAARVLLHGAWRPRARSEVRCGWVWASGLRTLSLLMIGGWSLRVRTKIKR